MKLQPFPTLVLCVLPALLLTGCSGVAVNEIYFPKGLPHHVAFNEADFPDPARTGSGVVQGQLVVHFKDGTTYEPAKIKVGLVPVNAYTSEIILRKYHNGAYLAKPDPRYKQYVRITDTDDQGHFRFTKLPPGQYYVGSKVTYETTFSYTDDNGYDETGPETDYWMTYAEVTVKDGQTVTISDWSSGPARFSNP